MRVGIVFPLLATLLFFLAASRPALCAPAAGSLTRVYGTVSGSFQEWQGGTSILQGSDISVEGSTVTISGGNITVYGSLTIQDAIISG
ncbi:MAG: hypothetical protein ABC588_07465, partial [Candidatus Methanosuratincola petrocarbonis]